MHPQVDLGKLLTEGLEIGRQLVEADAVNRRDGERTGHDITHRPEILPDAVVGLEDVLGRLEKYLSLGGHREIASPPLEKDDLELFLEGSDLLTHGALADAVARRRLGEAGGLHQIAKDLKGFDVHGPAVAIRNAAGIGKGSLARYFREKLSRGELSMTQMPFTRLIMIPVRMTGLPFSQACHPVALAYLRWELAENP